MLKKRKAQSILEYTLIFGAIIAAIIYAATKLVQPAVNSGMTDASQLIKDSTSKIGQLDDEIQLHGAQVNQ